MKGKIDIFFILKSKIPKRKRFTCARMFCAIQPQKSETHYVRLTAGGNFMSHASATSTYAVAITAIKPIRTLSCLCQGLNVLLLMLKIFT